MSGRHATSAVARPTRVTKPTRLARPTRVAKPPRAAGRSLRKTFASAGAGVVALALVAMMAIPTVAASASDPSATEKLTFSNRQSQALTVSQHATIAAATRDSFTVVLGYKPAGPGIGNTGGWADPIRRPVNSPWGPRNVICTSGVGCDAGFHRGDDFAAACGTPFYAASAGVVTSITYGGLAGDEIVIAHAGGISTAYSHMYDSGILVSKGQQVSAGQNIGKVGSTGDSTGCHLYFEYRVGGITVDPQPAMAAHGIVLGVS
jgi:murein DD-endopeptidase MepM/ murein hydrolase activator NlpD